MFMNLRFFNIYLNLSYFILNDLIYMEFVRFYLEFIQIYDVMVCAHVMCSNSRFKFEVHFFQKGEI
jgi:hypothetical protein